MNSSEISMSVAKDDEGFDRDMRTIFVAQVFAFASPSFTYERFSC